ncbi:MAG: DUF6069 family protein [Candidatus Heimdallarchaeota archaeon]|jgi:hypothetical protein
MDDNGISISRLTKIGIVLTSITLIDNIIIYYIGNEFGAFDGFQVGGVEFGLSNVVILTLVLLFLGYVGFYLLVNILKIDMKLIRYVAILVVCLSLYLPVISIPEEEAITKIVLSLMHISSGITVIAGLTYDDLILKYIK